MTEQCARAILRLIAIMTVTVGLCMAMTKFFAYIAANRAMPDMMSNTVTQMGTYATLSYLAVAGLGLVLFALSTKLAALVVE